MPKKDKDSKKEEVKKVKSSGKGEKFADMSATAAVIEEVDVSKVAEIPASPTDSAKVSKAPRVRGKRYRDVKKLVDSTKLYPIKEALELLKKVSLAKFGGSVEVHLNVLEKGLSGKASLPYFQGKARKVAVFDDELAEKIKAGKIDFEILLATPADMPKILPLAKILGPKGLMPNPKNGTLTADPKKAAEKLTSGSALHFKTDKDYPTVHAVIGKFSQPESELEANFSAFIKAVGPKNIQKAIIKSTMSPAIKVAF